MFVGGAALLAVELAASRVLAPFFGNSLFVWGALIGIVLAGLAAAAHSRPVSAHGPAHECARVGGAAVLAMPLVDDAVLEAVVAWDPGLVADP